MTTIQKPHTATLTVHTSAPVQQGNLLAGQWYYLPGAERESDGLRILAMPFAIVAQDGTGGQANYPVNLYGTHLEGASDFSVHATLGEVKGTGAGMQLYGQVPVIADEFRIERKSVRLYIHGNNLEMALWNGDTQQPSATTKATLQTPLASGMTIDITRNKGEIIVSTNGRQAARMGDADIFTDGSVWFGFDAGTDSFKLTRLEATALAGSSFRITDSSGLRVSNPDMNGLQALAAAKRPGFLVGAAMALGPMVTDTPYARTALGGNFGALTPENAMKWQFTEPVRGRFDFSEGDALVQLAQRHGMKVQGHTLVFAEANPAWVRNVPARELESVMTAHISRTVGHFKGKIYSWDVVNEPFDDDAWDSLRPHLWYKAMGEDYIAKAFRAARTADPQTLLFMNEYGLEEDGERWDAFLALVTRLKQQGVPIDGVGFQAHVYARADRIYPDVLRKHMRQLAAIGVQSRVSEMDVYIEDGTETQSQQYADVFQACLAEPSCISWTTWGITDRYNYFIDDDNSIQQGEDFLWSAQMTPTPAAENLRQILRQ